MDTVEYGIVYVLTNPVMPGIIKIGMTQRNDIEGRLRELYTTGVPVPYIRLRLMRQKGISGI